MPEHPNPRFAHDLPPVSKRPEGVAGDYAELEVTTSFSFLRGASHPDELVYRAAELGYRALAVTDVNSLAGVVRAHDACRQVAEQGGRPPKLMIGARLVLEDGPELLAWAPDRAAYGRLCRLLTLGKRRSEKGECALGVADVIAHSDGMLAAVAWGDEAERGIDSERERGRESAIRDLREALGDRLSLAGGCLYGGDDRAHLAELMRLSRLWSIPLLAANHVHYHAPERRALQDVLTCIRHGCTIQEAGFRLFPNGERYLKSPAQMQRLFAECPQAIRRGLEIAERCRFSLDELKYEYPDELTPPGKTAIAYLADLAWKGAVERYCPEIDSAVSSQHSALPLIPPKVRDLITHELTLIERLKYENYFLTVYDLVQFARSRGILCQGRGSAANSAVCYCIGITSVDPARIDVLFERFISAARNEPPDIDVDFEHERREEVIQYIYEKYGRERAGMTAEIITYRGRSAVRDVGKALGLSLDLVDQMAKKLDWWHRGTLDEGQIRDLGLDPADRTVRLVVELTGQLLGFPRHLSQHVGGMVMTRGPLCELVPIENASMADRTVIEWDKDDIDALGILKVDVLALGMLTCISKAFQLIRVGAGHAPPSPDLSVGARHALPSLSHRTTSYLQSGRGMPRPYELANQARARHASPLQLHTIPPEDPAVYDMIDHADTIGVFQIESRAQMSMLPRLRPNCFYDLVIEVAIVRPGPIQGNMVHPYLRRRNGEEPVQYPSEALREVLHKTLGVPLFQEQAMRVAMVGAGFSADEADRLRRAMAAWRKSGALETFHDKIVAGMLKNGYTREFAEQCFLQIRGFGEYGFPESHAASFALLVYVSAWIKRYYPAEFCAALLNSQPMGFYAPAQIVKDAQNHGIMVRAVDVNFSDWDCSPVGACPAPTSSVRLGFRQIRGFQIVHAHQLVAARNQHGPFNSIPQLHRATALPRHALKRLAEADAFASLGLSRRQALWQVLALSDADLPLFDPVKDGNSEVENGLALMPLGQEVMIDYRTAGLSLKRHPVSLVRDKLSALRIITAAEMRGVEHGSWVRVAGLVLIRQRPGTASGIVFVTLEDETGIVNLIVRPDVYDKYRAAARQAALLHAEGRVERQGEVIHLMVRRLYDQSPLLAGYQFTSRDFH